ncbi:hypothetical protein M011DRAFT_393651 [Sporormia fimetaria CBS 119925]|uniref:DUF8004 domain-containing protein n=1 Tax=Sporormia fimetaria CBS 119925 TaxID=1340428 RepID=A0A6A6VN61_9PLEO|nr:hypothetical protein M011DRAFT_393651 [Sporormia fimetaria CBS 119925]
MLSTLQPEILMMYDLDQDTQCSNRSREHSLQIILQYLNRRGLDDVRNSVKTALDLLAWSELENVKWKQGYIESFTHLVGVMSPQVEELPEFRRLSVGTRRNLTIAAKSLQLRVMEAEEKLAAFDFSELWGDDPRVTSGTIHQSYTAFRQFLINHYTRAYGNWPPVQGSTWLNRRIVRALQDDFGTLYDYLVDRDVVWDSQEERPGRKWQMVKRRDEEFHPDSLLSVTDMLVNFDSKHGYLHIPHPYPLLPREVAQVKSPVKKGFFSSLKKPKVDVSRDAKTHLQLSIIFSDATNIEKMDASSNGYNLIDQFERFELNAELKNATPREARLGRWILLYGILQVLSTLSVDVRGLKWTQGVRHFLCAELKRCPEWVTEGQTEYLEASQTRSWCWQRPWSPTRITYQPAELEGNAMRVVEESDAATLDGATMINEDIRRIGEKIDRMRMTVQGNGDLGHRRGSERRVEKGKMRESGLDMAKGIDDSYRLTQSDYERRPLPPIIPLRSQHRSPLREHGPGYDEFQGMQGKRGDYFGGYRDDRAGWV